jgi:hypothetical protein
MFWRCFTYDYKGLCHIYYTETKEQKEANEERMAKLNDEEIKDEACKAFETQEREKERK